MIRPRYPIYIVSKGRHDPKLALTVAALRRDEVPFAIAVEPQEAEAYKRLVGAAGIVYVLPFSNLGMGSTPARNWVRDHAIASGRERHWILDDNIIEFRRLWHGRRIPCHAGAALSVCEDLTDRFSNVGVSGLNYQMFVPAEMPVPFYRNTHVYSCILLNHAMPHTWRMRYNEDTDLCLQALVGGWATILVNAFMANKLRTMVMMGGNTEELYDAGGEAAQDTATFGRFQMARSLERAWPGLVKTRWRFGRPQHSVHWGAFRERPALALRPGLDLGALPPVDERGLRLRAVREVRSARLRGLLGSVPEPTS